MNNDLISRSALMRRFGTDPYFSMYPNDRRIFEILTSAPAVDAEVVRHGRWISENIRKKSYLRQCSVCNKIAYFCGTGCSYNYCPNCGAKMNAEVEG